MNLEKLLDLNYLLDRYPAVGFSTSFKLFLLLFFITSIIIGIKSGKRLNNNPGIMKKVYNNLETWGWTTGILGLLLFFFREVNAIYLGSRVWMLIFFNLVIDNN